LGIGSLSPITPFNMAFHQISIQDTNPLSLPHSRRHRLNTPPPLHTNIHPTNHADPQQ
jgi:hypothetical protein